MCSTSRDEGRTWSPPERTGLDACFPNLAVLSDGLLALSYGRPGAMLAFRADHGRTWTDATCIDATPYYGYTDVAKVETGLLAVGFGAAGYRDPRRASGATTCAWPACVIGPAEEAKAE